MVVSPESTKKSTSGCHWVYAAWRLGCQNGNPGQYVLTESDGTKRALPNTGPGYQSNDAASLLTTPARRLRVTATALRSSMLFSPVNFKKEVLSYGCDCPQKQHFSLFAPGGSNVGLAAHESQRARLAAVGSQPPAHRVSRQDNRPAAQSEPGQHHLRLQHRRGESRPQCPERPRHPLPGSADRR